MAPKAQKRSGAKKTGEEEKEESFQAVVLADTFETRFTPFTIERPRCLLPLANTPLIEYTLEYLASAGVCEVFLYGGAHIDQVETYISASKWKSSTSPFKQFVFLKSSAGSVGDVMRDLDQKHLITGDFVTVTGDIVSNFSLDPALKAHKLRRLKDKNAIMTMLLRETSERLTESVVPTFIIDPTKSRCLHYEETVNGQMSNPSNDPDLLSESELDVRQDLIDCRIDICTPDVLSLWSDNFDNQSPRKDFLHGVLKDHELNGKTIHTFVIKDHYAARVESLLSYASISHDIMVRQAFPICPTTNLFSDQDYTEKGNWVYQEDGVVLARSCRIDPRTMIGRGTSVGAGSAISQSVIGRRCQIGKNVRISRAFIWDDTVVGDDVSVLGAIIANEASVGDRCRIEEGALVSYGVRLAPDTKVNARARITSAGASGNAKFSGREPSAGSETGPGYQYEMEGETTIKSPGLGKVHRFPSRSMQLTIEQSTHILG